MALLTEEQINDILDITNVWESGIIVSNLIEWNEKQDSKQIEIDWNDAPKNATKAVLRMHWVTEDKKSGSVLWSGASNTVTFERPTPAITPHPHAEMMAKYAEVAARRVDPWVEFEVRCEVKGWTRCSGFNGFHSDFEYRHIGDNK